MTRTPSEIPSGDNTDTDDWQPDEDNPTKEVLDFSSEQCDAIQIYINELAKAMRLYDWDIYLASYASKPATNASVHALIGRRIAALYVNKDWFTYSPEMQRHTLIHELVHIVHHFQTEVIRLTKLPPAVWPQFNIHTEYMTDHLADIIAPFMPLPITPDEVMDAKLNKEKWFAVDGN
jgi:hypothetical protein